MLGLGNVSGCADGQLAAIQFRRDIYVLPTTAAAATTSYSSNCNHPVSYRPTQAPRHQLPTDSGALGASPSSSDCGGTPSSKSSALNKFPWLCLSALLTALRVKP